MCVLNSLVSSVRIILSLTLLSIQFCLAEKVSSERFLRFDAHKTVFNPLSSIIIAPSDRVIVISTPGRCDTDVVLPPATINLMPGCTLRSVTVNAVKTTLSTNGGTVNFGTGIYRIVYCAVDNCSSTFCDTMVLVVLDSQAPNMACMPEAVVNLNSDGVGFVPASHLDGGSYDECGHVFFKAKRMNLPIGYSCQPAQNPFNKFDDEVHFCCRDISNSPIPIILRAYDIYPGSGIVDDSFYLNHYVECMVMITVKDKIDPILNVPPDITINCGTDLDSLYSAMKADYRDNCYSPVLEERIIRKINACGYGTIERIFTVYDSSGVFVSKTQKITITPKSTFNGLDPNQLRWPEHKTIFACRVNTDTIDAGKPIIVEYECDNVTVSSKDDKYSFNRGGVCAKILRHWIVVNWCIYNPSFSPDPRVPENGYYKFDQEIKIMDTIPPVLLGIKDTLLYSLSPNCGAANFKLSDVTASDCGQTSNIRISYSVDYYSDGLTDRSGNGGNAGGIFPMGKHKVIYTAEDSCHNMSQSVQFVTVKDGKAPAITVHYGLSTNLQLMADRVMAIVNASRFNNKSEDNCTPSYQLHFSFSKDPADSIRIFGCDEIGVQELEIFVWDECGNYSSARTFITVYDLNGVCPGNIKTSNITGIISTSTGKPLENVEVIMKDSVHFDRQNTNSLGGYTFNGMNVGTRFILEASCNDEPVRGVSTADIVKIQQHILGKSILENPYEILSADVDMNEKININDITWLRRLILGITTELPVKKSYLFMDKNIVFTQPNNPWPDYYRSSVPGGIIRENGSVMDFTGIKLGDVNSSIAQRLQTTFVIYYRIEQNSLVFRTKNDIDVLGFQLNLTSNVSGLFDPSITSLFIEEGYDHEIVINKNGVFQIIAHRAHTIHYNENDIILSIPIKTSEADKLGSLIVETTGECEMVDQEMSSRHLIVRPSEASNRFEVIHWGPNPVQDSYHVIMRNGSESDIYYELINQEGKIKSYSCKQPKSEFCEIVINKNEFGPAGMYILRIISSQGTWSDKIVIE